MDVSRASMSSVASSGGMRASSLDEESAEALKATLTSARATSHIISRKQVLLECEWHEQQCAFVCSCVGDITVQEYSDAMVL